VASPPATLKTEARFRLPRLNDTQVMGPSGVPSVNRYHGQPRRTRRVRANVIADKNQGPDHRRKICGSADVCTVATSLPKLGCSLRCGAATKADSGVVALYQDSHRNPSQDGGCTSGIRARRSVTIGSKRIDCRPRAAMLVGTGMVGLLNASNIHSYPGRR
jgi:hypothetical protein